jgi:hypothetical protein
MPQSAPLLSSSDDRVRVYVSHETAFDLEKMNKITATVLGRLGCLGCHSGRVLDFVTIEDYIVDPKTLEVTELMPNGG